MTGPRTIEQIEYDLYTKFASSFTRMLDSTENERRQLEDAYHIENGELEDWVKTRVEILLDKAQAIESRYGPFVKQ